MRMVPTALPLSVVGAPMMVAAFADAADIPTSTTSNIATLIECGSRGFLVVPPVAVRRTGPAYSTTAASCPSAGASRSRRAAGGRSSRCESRRRREWRDGPGRGAIAGSGDTCDYRKTPLSLWSVVARRNRRVHSASCRPGAESCRMKLRTQRSSRSARRACPTLQPALSSAVRAWLPIASSATSRRRRSVSRNVSRTPQI
jgi:hypothetical protein